MQQRIAVGFIIINALAALAAAQTAPAVLTAPATPRYLAHLVTFSPGRMVWERFGHNAIFITDLTRTPPLTVAYDFGNFDFAESDFLWRFVFGEMRYWAAAKDAGEMWHEYTGDNRQIHRQELELTDEQVRALWRNLQDNIAPEHRYYHYNYYADNCSTRIRDHLDRITDGAISAALKARRADHDYRWHTRIGMEGEPLLLAGVEFASAGYVDRPITAWEESFVPEKLRLHLEQVQVRAADGSLKPLVRHSGTMNPYIQKSSFVELPQQPRILLPWFAAAGIIAAVLLVLGGYAARQSKSGRWLAAALFAMWGLLAGLAGLLLVFMWGFTRHVAAYANENLLQLSPLALGLVVLGPLAAFGRGLTAARWLAIVLLACVLIGIVLKALPWMRQDNWNIIALSLPATVGLLAAVVLRGRGPKLSEGTANE